MSICVSNSSIGNGQYGNGYIVTDDGKVYKKKSAVTGIAAGTIGLATIKASKKPIQRKIGSNLGNKFFKLVTETQSEAKQYSEAAHKALKATGLEAKGVKIINLAGELTQ